MNDNANSSKESNDYLSDGQESLRRPCEVARRIERAQFTTRRDGYEIWRTRVGKTNKECRVHHLLAIANGADPHTVFAEKTHTHHKNGIPWDNRAANLEVLTHSEHSTLHNQKQWGDSPWRDEEVLRRLHVDEKMNHHEMAEELGCDLSTVRNWTDKRGIERPKQALSCGHTGFVNLGDDEYTCSNDECTALYTREEIEEVFA